MSEKDGRSEKATPQRRKKARDEGNVPRSQEVAVAGSFLGMVTVLAIGGGWMVDQALAQVHTIYATAGSAGALGAVPVQGATLFAVLAGPFLFAAAVTGTAAGVAQVGVKFNPKLAKPKAKNLSIKKGLDKFKPKTAAWELARTVLKLGVVFGVLWPTLSAWRDHIQNDRTLAGAIDRLTGTYGGIIFRAAILALIIAALDFTFQKKKIDKQIMMSRRDIRREFRDNEGDPYQKAARKQRAAEMSRNGMLRDVATADAVLANPTHLVVALRYDPGEGAPRVIAKGADLLADQIKLIARRHGIPVTTDIPLARALYKQCRVGQHVPVELYQAVAIVLAAAYRRTGRAPGSRLPERSAPGRRTVRVGGTA